MKAVKLILRMMQVKKNILSLKALKLALTILNLPKKAKIAKLMTSELTSALDRTKMSNREAVLTNAATDTSLGHDINIIC